MNAKSPCAFVLAISLSCLMAVPPNSLAAPQATGQRAGEVSRVIPAVSIARNTRNITASPKSVVDWNDMVNTQVNARARIALDDGSVLNVGAESSLKVVKHDGAAQQTELELTYGKLRSQAQKIARPDGKFEVRTPAGVAGVVGTDFYIGYENGTMNVIVFDGFVRVCNLAGVCVVVKAGQMTSVRSGDNSAPLAPNQATLDILTDAVTATNLNAPGGGPAGVETATHAVGGWGGLIGIAVVAAIPAILVPTVAGSGGGRTAPKPVVTPPPTAGCSPNNPKAC